MIHYAVSSRNAKKTLSKPGVTSSTLCSRDVIKLSVGIAHSALVLFFLLLLLAYSATNSTISSKTVESYYFYSSCFSILGHVPKCVK